MSSPRKHLGAAVTVPGARLFQAELGNATRWESPRNTPKGPPAPRMAGGPFGGDLRVTWGVTPDQEALASVFFGSCATAGAGAGLAAS
ncbi:hypothetical protein GCM10018777_52370 [Streptomyces albogriseolus]|nr:hypothetical protein GCM10018777_52370 [Streptomyces viridodiastaticus]